MSSIGSERDLQNIGLGPRCLYLRTFQIIRANLSSFILTARVLGLTDLIVHGAKTYFPRVSG